MKVYKTEISPYKQFLSSFPLPLLSLPKIILPRSYEESWLDKVNVQIQSLNARLTWLDSPNKMTEKDMNIFFPWLVETFSDSCNTKNWSEGHVMRKIFFMQSTKPDLKQEYTREEQETVLRILSEGHWNLPQADAGIIKEAKVLRKLIKNTPRCIKNHPDIDWKELETLNNDILQIKNYGEFLKLRADLDAAWTPLTSAQIIDDYQIDEAFRKSSDNFAFTKHSKKEYYRNDFRKVNLRLTDLHFTDRNQIILSPSQETEFTTNEITHTSSLRSEERQFSEETMNMLVKIATEALNVKDITLLEILLQSDRENLLRLTGEEKKIPPVLVLLHKLEFEMACLRSRMQDLSNGRTQTDYEALQKRYMNFLDEALQRYLAVPQAHLNLRNGYMPALPKKQEMLDEYNKEQKLIISSCQLLPVGIPEKQSKRSHEEQDKKPDSCIKKLDSAIEEQAAAMETLRGILTIRNQYLKIMEHTYLENCVKLDHWMTSENLDWAKKFLGKTPLHLMEFRQLFLNANLDPAFPYSAIQNWEDRGITLALLAAQHFNTKQSPAYTSILSLMVKRGANPWQTTEKAKDSVENLINSGSIIQNNFRKLPFWMILPLAIGNGETVKELPFLMHNDLDWQKISNACDLFKQKLDLHFSRLENKYSKNNTLLQILRNTYNGLVTLLAQQNIPILLPRLSEVQQSMRKASKEIKKDPEFIALRKTFLMFEKDLKELAGDSVKQEALMKSLSQMVQKAREIPKVNDYKNMSESRDLVIYEKIEILTEENRNLHEKNLQLHRVCEQVEEKLSDAEKRVNEATQAKVEAEQKLIETEQKMQNMQSEIILLLQAERKAEKEAEKAEKAERKAKKEAEKAERRAEKEAERKAKAEAEKKELISEIMGLKKLNEPQMKEPDVMTKPTRKIPMENQDASPAYQGPGFFQQQPANNNGSMKLLDLLVPEEMLDAQNDAFSYK